MRTLDEQLIAAVDAPVVARSSTHPEDAQEKGAVSLIGDIDGTEDGGPSGAHDEGRN